MVDFNWMTPAFTPTIPIKTHHITTSPHHLPHHYVQIFCLPIQTFFPPKNSVTTHLHHHVSLLLFTLLWAPPNHPHPTRITNTHNYLLSTLSHPRRRSIHNIKHIHTQTCIYLISNLLHSSPSDHPRDPWLTSSR